jgi:hypothetical protein
MNLDRGFRRIAILGSAVYWLWALPSAGLAVWQVYTQPPVPPHPSAAVLAVCLMALAIAVGLYLVLVGAFSAVRWVVTGFAKDPATSAAETARPPS